MSIEPRTVDGGLEEVHHKDHSEVTANTTAPCPVRNVLMACGGEAAD